MEGICEAVWYCRNCQGQMATACPDLAFTEISGRSLCWVHASVVKAGHATLEQVLRGERPKLRHSYTGATERE